jgi:hypothetical protein
MSMLGNNLRIRPVQNEKDECRQNWINRLGGMANEEYRSGFSCKDVVPEGGLGRDGMRGRQPTARASLYVTYIRFLPLKFVSSFA